MKRTLIFLLFLMAGLIMGAVLTRVAQQTSFPQLALLGRCDWLWLSRGGDAQSVGYPAESGRLCGIECCPADLPGGGDRRLSALGTETVMVKENA